MTVHARRRAKQRGLPISNRQLHKLAVMIAARDPRCLFVRIMQDGKMLYAVPHAGQYRPVIFAPNGLRIVTVLPLRVLPVKLQFANPRS